MSTRLESIAVLRHRFVRDHYPRLTMAVILAFAGGAAFLSSAAALRAGLTSMGFRYGLAVLTGYAAFLVLIRGWIALWRREWEFGWHASDTADTADTLMDTDRASADVLDPTPALERSRDVAGGAARVATRRKDSSVFSRMVEGLFPDLDELGFVLIVIVAVLGALFAAFYVIYAAPLLLAEVALDAALVSAVYRRLRQEDVGHWSGAVVRYTWMPTLGLLVCMTAAGFALQRIVPGAHSVGGVIRAFVN